MLVVFQHSCWTVDKYESQLGLAEIFKFNSFAVFGGIGVDLFFIISGFVMALSARRFVGPSMASQFLLQRFLRIAPLLYLISLVIYANLMRVGVDVPLRQLVNSFLIVPFFDVHMATDPLHYFGWTLAYEFVFYFWVAALIALNRSTRPGLLLALLCLLPLVGYLLPSKLVLLQLMTNWMMWEFALGVAAFVLWDNGYLQRYRGAVSTVAVATLFALAIQLYFGYMNVTELNLSPVYETQDSGQALYRAAQWGLPCFLLFCGALVTDFQRLKYVFPGLLLLGNASYSIYLSQILVYNPVIKLGIVVGVPADLLVLILLGACALTGILCYRWIEQPMNRKLQRWARESYESRHRGAHAEDVTVEPKQHPG